MGTLKLYSISSESSDLRCICSTGEYSHRWRRHGDMGGADVPVSRGAAGQELSSCDGARQTRQGVPKTGLQVRQTPLSGPQGESERPTHQAPNTCECWSEEGKSVRVNCLTSGLGLLSEIITVEWFDLKVLKTHFLIQLLTMRKRVLHGDTLF